MSEINPRDESKPVPDPASWAFQPQPCREIQILSREIWITRPMSPETIAENQIELDLTMYRWP